LSTDPKYVIVDDDPFNNTICSLMLQKTLIDVQIKTFTLPSEGLLFIKNKYETSTDHTVLFLDLNMLEFTGWEFLKKFEKLNEKTKDKVRIYLLSSSVIKSDWDKAKANKYVKGFVSKPLYREKIISIEVEEY
jgi:response regulator RpfG family c-di-GMP phosphodiesterase